MSPKDVSFFCRETDVFPIREVNFSCLDSDIAYKDGEPTYSDFAYNAFVPFDVICPLAFCVPPFIVSTFLRIQMSFLLKIISCEIF